MAVALTKAGRYQIIGELGRGSMGVVYQGFDPIIHRTVAIKTMLPAGLSEEEFQAYRERFQREAMAAGVLAHPNIITIYDFGDDNGVLYLAMEFLDGKSLDRIVNRQGILPIETIVPIYDQVCSALDHAHQNKIVHRDIKPANIMLLNNGLVKVTDFGIAKVMAMGMTQAGQILGTPNYMSPEQIRGREIDGRSDIFSLGVILYELVTGEKPFAGQNITTVIYKIVNENPIPPRELDASIPPGLSYVISKALAKSADERYQTCLELAEDLRNYKSVGGPAVGRGTVLLTRPPIQAADDEEIVPVPLVIEAPQPPPTEPPSASSAIGEAPLGRSPDVQAPAPQPAATVPPVHTGFQMSRVVVSLGILTVIAIISAFFMMRRGNKPEVPESAAQVPLPQTQPPVPTPSPQPSVPAKDVATPVVTARAAPAKTRDLPAQQSAPRAPAEPVIGSLAVTANVNGAKISIDGRSDPSWLTPFTFSELSPGAHVVVVSMDGYDVFQQSVTVVGGQTENVEANLVAGKAEINVITVPAGIEVLVDGKSYGPSPIRAVLPAGNHTYVVKPSNQPPYESSFTLSLGQILTKKVTLSGSLSTGVVEVRTTPPGATVMADGSPVGNQTPTSFRLPVGSHTLVISESGYKPTQKQVVVSENDTTSVKVDLTSQ
jgi:serine/threonine protein kinase